MTAAATAIPAEARVSRLVNALGRRPEAAYEIGHTLGELSPGGDSAWAQLVALAANEEPAALVGYLYALVEAGAGDAFDQLLDSGSSDALSDLAVSGCPCEARRAVPDGRASQR